MKKADILKMANVLPINKDSDNIIFISNHALTMKDAHELARAMREKNETGFGAIVMVDGLPNEVVKLVSAKSIKEIGQSGATSS